MVKPKKTAVKARVESEALISAKAALAGYLKANPQSTVRELKIKDPVRVVDSPWADASVAFLIPKNPDGLFEALNNVYLPNRLTAIYHLDKKLIEVIWTSYKLEDDDQETAKRKFEFKYMDKSYECYFGKSSDRLLELARYALFVSISDTGFRNLQSFTAYTRSPPGKEKDQNFGDPTSFFIENIEWKEEKVLELLRHLSFYMRYFDGKSPYIIIHPPASDLVINPKSRFIDGSFPAKIDGRNLSPILLSLSIASYDKDISTNFLLNYRILEYVSSYYLKFEQRSLLERILSSPSVSNDITTVMDKVAGVFREDKTRDAQRFASMVADLVSEDRIWKEISLNPAAFTKEVEFDGGFKLGALVANTKSQDCFGPKGMENFARSIREIRNALSHGGEAQSGRIILPSSENFKKLLPWVHLISTAACEAILYEHLG